MPALNSPRPVKIPAAVVDTAIQECLAGLLEEDPVALGSAALPTVDSRLRKLEELMKSMRNDVDILLDAAYKSCYDNAR